MFAPQICYIIVGVPGSGKSTLAEQMVKYNPSYQIVSTDRIRAQLYGDEAIQGNWQAIQEEVFSQIEQALSAQHPIIYDATNFKRPQRIAFLQKLAKYQNVYWVAWHLQTPLATCIDRNQLRSRQVPDAVIQTMHQWLSTFPPIPAEGFANVIPIPESFLDLKKITPNAQKIARSITNCKNRNKNIMWHRYSQLLDFERLMHLIALIIHYPGIGNLQQTDPHTLKNILGTEEVNFASAIEEICALMSKLYCPIYADCREIATDLEFLGNSGILDCCQPDYDIEVPEYLGDTNTLAFHTYSDLYLFARLLKTIRFIVQEPFLRDEQNSLDMLLQGLQSNKVYTSRDILRNDIRVALKPYKILPETPMKRGYFIGTAILAKHELKEVFKVLQSQAESLSDPAAVAIYEAFKDRMKDSNILEKADIADIYPVRAIGNQAIVDIDSLPDYAIYKNLQILETAIEKGELLQLDRILGTGRFPNDPHQDNYFYAWPLQLVFHNIGWYLGYECVEPSKGNLFRFERLDRIFVVRSRGECRKKEEQKKSLQKLDKLYKASMGIFLGNSVEDQKNFLSSDKDQQASAEVTVELWCTNQSFKFISEGTKRFPANRMKMSQPLVNSKLNIKKSIFFRDQDSQSGDSKFPYRFQVKLPVWSLQDIDLKRWIIGFGGQVKVVKPDELVKDIQQFSQELSSIYSR